MIKDIKGGKAYEATLYSVVRSTGTNVQMFLDNWLIADSANIKRTHSTAVSKDMIHWTEGVRMYSIGTPGDSVAEGMIRYRHVSPGLGD